MLEVLPAQKKSAIAAELADTIVQCIYDMHGRGPGELRECSVDQLTLVTTSMSVAVEGFCCCGIQRSWAPERQPACCSYMSEPIKSGPVFKKANI